MNINPLNNPNQYPLPVQFPRRRELKGLLVDFERALTNSPWGTLSHKIQNWVREFNKAMQTEDVAPAQEDFLYRLQTLLIDPIFHVPLNEDALLGTDGLIYDKKSLLLYLSGFKSIVPLHAPRFHENPAEITVEPLETDSIVPKLVRWLKQNEAYHTNQVIETAFAAARGLPALPTKENERFRCLRENLIAQRLQRELLGKLGEFGELFNSSPLQDNVTEHLRNWHRLFTIAVTETHNVTATKKEFVQLLQDILQDPIVHCLLDDEPLLGSDLLTYSKKGLALFLRELPHQFRNRAPLDLENPAVFTVQPHPIAAAMIQWLISLGCYQPNRDIELLYQNLADQGELPELPTEENLFIAKLREQEAERERQKEAELGAFAKEMLHEMFEHIQNAFVPVNEKIEQDGNDLVQQVIEKRAIKQQAYEIIMNAIEALGEEAVQFDRRVDGLMGGIKQVNSNIVKVDRQNAELTKSIGEVSQALRDRKKGWLKALLTTIAIIGGCAVGTVILQSIASKYLTITLPPPKVGGAGGMLNLGFKV